MVGKLFEGLIAGNFSRDIDGKNNQDEMLVKHAIAIMKSQCTGLSLSDPCQKATKKDTFILHT